MNKVSAEQKQAIYAEVPQVLRALVEERDSYRDKLAAIELRSSVEKLAATMIDRGLESGSVLDLAARLEKQASTGQIDLARMQDAVEFQFAPNMGKTAHLSDELDGSAAASAFEREILS